ncbi:MAG: hypothetical protein ACXWUX_11835 [Allosphingosinicella sp.]
MSLILMAALQATAPVASTGVVRTDFDLADIRWTDEGPNGGPSLGCRRRSSDEILVCGRRPGGEDYPIAEMSRLFAQRPIVAEMSLGGSMTGRAFVDSAVLDRGAISNRIMFGIRLPF